VEKPDRVVVSEFVSEMKRRGYEVRDESVSDVLRLKGNESFVRRTVSLEMIVHVSLKDEAEELVRLSAE
jgi:hypothetical protein